jgi:hypothetical protein
MLFLVALVGGVVLIVAFALGRVLMLFGRASFDHREPSSTTLMGVALRTIALAVLVFLFITLLEDRVARLSKDGLVTSLFGPVSLGAWIALASRLVIRGRPYIHGSWDPVIAWAVLLGVASGLAGAFEGWWIYQQGWGAPATSGGGPGVPLPHYWYGDRDGLIRWPIVGAVTCGLVAVVMSAAHPMRGPRQTPSH